MLEPLPDSFLSTREAMHALAEHVIAPARYRVDAHIGLVPTTGGFGTPTFGDGQRVRVEGVELVSEHPGTTTRVGITTIGDAGRFLDIQPGAPTNVYRPATACVLDASLEIDAAAARALADWFAFVAGLLDELVDAYRAHSPSVPTIWPEHFDLATDFGDRDAGTRATYGGSPGDGAIGEPYLYVSPWDEARRTGRFGEQPFGAALTYRELQAASDSRDAGREFLFEGAALLLGQP